MNDASKIGNLLPANGGTEEPFTARDGRRLLYVWDTTTGKHYYLDLASDMVLSDADADTI